MRPLFWFAQILMVAVMMLALGSPGQPARAVMVQYPNADHCIRIEPHHVPRDVVYATLYNDSCNFDVFVTYCFFSSNIGTTWGCDQKKGLLPTGSSALLKFGHHDVASAASNNLFDVAPPIKIVIMACPWPQAYISNRHVIAGQNVAYDCEGFGDGKPPEVQTPTIGAPVAAAGPDSSQVASNGGGSGQAGGGGSGQLQPRSQLAMANPASSTRSAQSGRGEMSVADAFAELQKCNNASSQHLPTFGTQGGMLNIERGTEQMSIRIADLYAQSYISGAPGDTQLNVKFSCKAGDTSSKACQDVDSLSHVGWGLLPSAECGEVDLQQLAATLQRWSRDNGGFP